MTNMNTVYEGYCTKHVTHSRLLSSNWSMSRLDWCVKCEKQRNKITTIKYGEHANRNRNTHRKKTTVTKVGENLGRILG